MAKQLRFTYNSKDYVLEFTRRSVEQMEKKGFVASDIETKPMTVLPTLWAGTKIDLHIQSPLHSILWSFYTK